jgi:3',5'-cyclic AMP phosphodiesterase CpdA
MLFSSRKPVATIVVLYVQILVFVLGTAQARGNGPDSTYSFVYLGDLHFDKMSHHDLEWVKANMPGDMQQIDDYVRNTQEYTPGLFKRVQTAIESSDGQIKMIVQGGDLTEGLCGRAELQELQFKDALETIRHYIPKTPFIPAKGNHDITGPGARDAYDRIMLPWLSHECGQRVDSASFHFSKGPDLFVFFDAYHNNNLDWLEKTLKENSHRYAFVVMHPPAVPFDARSSWPLFSRAKEKDVRERFLNILGANKVLLLTAHLHKYGVVVRRTSTGAFVQFSMNSVINSPKAPVKNHLEGLKSYGASLVELEPEFQPDTRDERRTLLEREKPSIARFEYADFPGYAIIHVTDAKISADIYLGDSDKLWKTVSLVPMLDN